MDTDLTMQLLNLQTGRTQTLAQISIIKKNHEMEMELVNMIDQATQPAPAPVGQGTMVDKRA